MTTNNEEKLIEGVSKAIDKIDNSNTFDLDEILKAFQKFGINKLNMANSEIASQFHKRSVSRQKETKRFF